MTAAPHWETDWHYARACLEWQVELGVDEAICDAPVNRYLSDEGVKTQAVAESLPDAPAARDSDRRPDLPDPVSVAQEMAEAATDLPALRDALAAYAYCELQQGARNLVFSDGRPEARVMIIGEAPGREEDLQGKPFVGEAGRLLDRMFAAIDLRRDHPDPAHALYITNILPWRPPQNRDPNTAEREMFRPFVLRHIALAKPDIIVLMGRISAATMLETSEGITRIRGQWREVSGLPALPMLHPAYLLRNPAAKREAWADLLELASRMRSVQ